MHRHAISILAGPAALVLFMHAGTRPTDQPQETPRSGAQTPAGGMTTQQINDDYVQKISKQIAGHEQEPASKVFKNIQIMKNTPARTLLIIMNRGYAQALGVTCTHCHVEDDFSKDDKRPKRAAREMGAMHRSINDQLSKMQYLDPNPKGHFINCSTCHRGAVDPMLSDQ